MLVKSKLRKPLLRVQELERLVACVNYMVMGTGCKRKGIATVRLSDGSELNAELHWYEASGIGKCEFKIKRYID